MDASLINSTIDLAALVPGLRRQGRYFIGPCPFCGGEDRFNIKRTDEGDLWICRQCGDGKYHDAVDFRMRAEGKTFREVTQDTKYETRNRKQEAARGSRPGGSDPVSRIPYLAPPPDEDWQIRRLEDQKEVADNLRLTDAGEEAMATEQAATLRMVWAYLRRHRGLSPDTIRNYMLGYNLEGKTTREGYSYPPGLHIPCMVDGQLWYVKVRLPKSAIRAAAINKRRLPKYMMIHGGRAALFNADRLVGARVGVVVEGEFDAMLLGQFLPEGWAAVTMGGAGSLPDERFLPYFLPLDRVLLRLDNDEAGERALAAWRKLLPRAEPAPPLPDEAKDITEFWQMKGDLGEWIK